MSEWPPAPTCASCLRRMERSPLDAEWHCWLCEAKRALEYYADHGLPKEQR
jgi:hypothetical protein